MAASSSVATRIGPQVFISFRGEDVRNHFVSFLDPALRRANINVFLDENELLNTDLASLLTRIEESEIAMVIFSNNYPDSDRSLDGLAKMKELRDQGRLIVIPIFYNLDPLVVKELRGDFGDKFRDLQRIHLHQLERTQKWEEALVTIPDIRGMPRAEQRLPFHRVNGCPDTKISGSCGRERKPKRSDPTMRFHGPCNATRKRI
uniref:TIR domain-containing protein n=1 Tax=Brassica campestris TaxID=3711 RepID=M4E8I9_BRACM